MKKCSSCGKIATNSSLNYCEHCGAPLISVQETFTQQSLNYEATVSQGSAGVFAGTNSQVNAPGKIRNCAVVREMNNKNYVNIIDGGIERPAFVLAAGEKHVKTYHCSTLRKWRGGGNGYLTVTNKRVVMNTFGGRMTQSSETELENVMGFNIYNGYVYRLLALVGAIAMSATTFSLLVTGIGNCDSCEQGWGIFGTLILCAALTVLLYFISKRKVYCFSIASPGPNGPVNCGVQDIRRWFWFIIPITWVDSGVLVSALAGADWERIRLELGAMVYELKTQGDAAISNWK